MGGLQVKHEWSYESKREVLGRAISHLKKFAYWDDSPHHLEILKQIQEDLFRLEELDK